MYKHINVRVRLQENWSNLDWEVVFVMMLWWGWTEYDTTWMLKLETNWNTSRYSSHYGGGLVLWLTTVNRPNRILSFYLGRQTGDRFYKARIVLIVIWFTSSSTDLEWKKMIKMKPSIYLIIALYRMVISQWFSSASSNVSLVIVSSLAIISIPL